HAGDVCGDTPAAVASKLAPQIPTPRTRRNCPESWASHPFVDQTAKAVHPNCSSVTFSLRVPASSHSSRTHLHHFQGGNDMLSMRKRGLRPLMAGAAALFAIT